MRTLRRLGLAGLLAALTMFVCGSTAQATGSATGTGALSFIPARGMDISPIYVVASAPCPVQASNLRARVFGAGFPAAGTVVVSNSDAALSHTMAFGVPLQDTLRSFAQQAGTSLKGRYRIVLQCTDELGGQVFAQFSGVVQFQDHAHFTGPAPRTPPAEGVPIGFLAQVFSQFKAGPAAPAAAEPSVASIAPVPATPPAGSAVAIASRADAGQTTGWNGGSVLFAAVVVLLSGLLGAGGFLATRRKLTSNSRQHSSV